MAIKFKHPEYDFSFEVKFIIRDLEAVKTNIQNPFIMASGTLDNHLFDIPHSANYTIKNSLFSLMQHITGQQNIWDICKTAFDKDEEWGKWRNDGLLYEAYHKYTIKPAYVDQVLFVIDQWIAEAKEIMQKMIDAEEEKKRQREADYNRFTIIETYQLIMPTGGEDGTDGYFDGLIRNNSTGISIRVVAKNIFDVGFFSYPKRVEETEEVFNRQSWTDDEKDACAWIGKFSPFTTAIRM